MLRPVGEVTLYMGGMFSGKTTALMNDLMDAGVGAICFKPAIDTREEDEVISTHNGLEFPVTRITQASEVLRLLDRTITTIGIDEVSLFLDDPTLIPTIKALRGLGYAVVMSGLDLTSQDEPFGQMGTLACIADTCFKLRAKCACGKNASISRRKQESPDVVEIGGADKYVPQCRDCYYKAI